MSKVPMLWLSDSPSCTSGLGRITRDVCTRIAENLSDTFDIATLGFGGPGDKNLPFKEYSIQSVEGWQVPELPLVWKNHVRDREGILMCCWDPSRLGWLADPNKCSLPHVRRFLMDTENMRKFIYAPIDAEGPNGGLSVKLSQTLKGFDRVLNYTSWSSRVTGYPDHLPHGIDTSVFFPTDKNWAKRKFRQVGFQGLKDSSFLVGIVATNQARKDWALGIQTCRILVDRGLDVKVWIHTDAIERYWDIYALIVDYSLQGRVFITTMNFSDEQMASMYAACDVTLGIGLGEGFGYPIFESLACGTPVVHGDYAGAAEFLHHSMRSPEQAWRFEGPFCNQRPIFEPEFWADRAEGVKGMDGGESLLPDGLKWENVWPKWSEWLRKGVE
jgi:glycosyltransferase involved in cell wall biosynthesis